MESLTKALGKVGENPDGLAVTDIPCPASPFVELSDSRRETRNTLHPLTDILIIVFFYGC